MRNGSTIVIMSALKRLRNASGLYNLLKKLGLKSPDARMKYPSWLFNLNKNVMKKDVAKELKKREQEIADRRTASREKESG